MTDVIVSAEAVGAVQSAGLEAGALDDQLIGWLVDQAKADGIETGRAGRVGAATDAQNY
ncbi:MULTISPECIES: hypothetical protein [unclassified Streptomyces]|uniref:Uncharacterized protein n=1 Tax=Streptomyces sp. NBC_00060 TaxID=2975636 RepID=A0AAU2GRA4_9ACTN